MRRFLFLFITAALAVMTLMLGPPVALAVQDVFAVNASEASIITNHQSDSDLFWARSCDQQAFSTTMQNTYGAYNDEALEVVWSSFATKLNMNEQTAMQNSWPMQNNDLATARSVVAMVKKNAAQYDERSGQSPMMNACHANTAAIESNEIIWSTDGEQLKFLTANQNTKVNLNPDINVPEVALSPTLTVNDNDATRTTMNATTKNSSTAPRTGVIPTAAIEAHKTYNGYNGREVAIINKSPMSIDELEIIGSDFAIIDIFGTDYHDSRAKTAYWINEGGTHRFTGAAPTDVPMGYWVEI